MNDPDQAVTWYERLFNRFLELAVNHERLAAIVAQNSKDIAAIQEAEKSEEQKAEDAIKTRRSTFSQLVVQLVAGIFSALFGGLMGYIAALASTHKQ